MSFCLQAADESNRFLIGGVFKDGSILPLGAYADGKWSNNWEGPKPTTDAGWAAWAKKIDGIHKVDEIPIPWIDPLLTFPKKWIYQTSDAKKGEVTVSSTVTEEMSVGGFGNLCLVSSLNSGIYGIAVGGTQSVSFEMPDDVKNDGTKNYNLIHRLKDDFERLELSSALKQRKAAESWEGKHKDDRRYDHNWDEFPVNLTKDKQSKEKVSVDGLYEKKTKEGDFYFFSLVKKYPASVGDYKFNLVSYMFGWAVQKAGKPLKIIQEKMGFVDGDGRVEGLGGDPDFSDLYDLDPIGSFSLDGKMYWLFHADFYEAQDFLLFNVSSNNCGVVKFR